MGEAGTHKQPLRMDEYHELHRNVLEKCSKKSFKLMAYTIPGWLAAGYGEISSFVHNRGGEMFDSYSNLELWCIAGGMAWVALSGLPFLITLFSTRDSLRKESYREGFEREYYIVNKW